MHEIAGVHHIAIGVKDLERMKSFYTEVLEFKTLSQESPAGPRDVMAEITRGVTPVFEMCMLSQDAGGIAVELIRMETPEPRAIRQDGRYGDIGPNKITIAVNDAKKAYGELKEKVNFRSGPKTVEIPGWGDYSFVYGQDPEGNLIEFASGAGLPVKGRYGGVISTGMSVTDLERSLAFYQQHTGFDTLLAKPHEKFSGRVDEVAGGGPTRVRSCVLASSQGGGQVELYEVLEPRGRSIPSYTLWGDFGYLQTCLLCKNVPEIAEGFQKAGLEFVMRLKSMPGGMAAFTYIRDPDGITLEFLSFGQ
jgi:catechol 2,3-dioxygenase-like lactoylglutathione lyase family enzyme